MFDELSKYKEQDHFFLKINDDLKTVCNAPSRHGVFLINSLNRGQIDMVYIGCTDKFQELNEQIISMENFLKSQIKNEGADALDIYWYVTSTTRAVDNPKEIVRIIMQIYLEVFGVKPRWNK